MDSRKRKYNRFPVGKFQALKRQQLEKHRTILMADMELKNKKNDLHWRQRQLQRVDEKVGEIVREIEELREIEDELQPAKKIKRMPTLLQNGKINLNKLTARRRRKELLEAARKIHEGTKSSKESAEIGLLDAMEQKCSTKNMEQVFSSSKKIKKVIVKIHKKSVKKFEESESNKLRSVSTYYSGGVMGKIKYINVRKTNAYQSGPSSKRITVDNCSIPRLVPYNKMMRYIKGIDIGKLYSVRECLCQGLREQDMVNVVFRGLKELLLKLAVFYLSQSVYKLIWFNGQTNTFFVSLGGDGAPFGKYDVACAWLISFLNIGRGVLSSNENFLLFGANCTENSIPVQRFIHSLAADIKEIESTSYTVTVNNSPVTVKFYFSELPNDMKMLCFLAGELPNSAKYFSTFANVNYDDLKTPSGSFSLGAGGKWHPWVYEKRISVAKEVSAFKKKQSQSKKKLAPSTLRTQVTTFIASLKSRQEFPPPIGKLIERAHVEPLHLKNNVCAHAHKLLLEEVLHISDLPESLQSFSMVPTNSPFYKYITAMRTGCKLGRLADRITRWYSETKSHGKGFDYRFTGKDSRMFLHNFMILISSVIPCVVTTDQHFFALHIIAYLCLYLRECVSLFNRYKIYEDQVAELKTHCLHYFKLNRIFFNHAVTPSVWHVGYIVPTHAEYMLGKYGYGLALNSMEGREAKHIAISKYSKNTYFKCRWEQVFQHEYVSLIWLRERGLNWAQPIKNSMSYIPKRTEDTSAYCYCGMEKLESDNSCSICSHRLREKIKLSIQLGKSLFAT